MDARTRPDKQAAKSQRCCESRMPGRAVHLATSNAHAPTERATRQLSCIIQLSRQNKKQQQGVVWSMCSASSTGGSGQNIVRICIKTGGRAWTVVCPSLVINLERTWTSWEKAHRNWLPATLLPTTFPKKTLRVQY